MTTNAELLARHKAVLPSWLAQYYNPPISLDSGEGRHVFDVEGNRYLDFFGGILTTSLGYNIPEVTQAIQAQAPKTLHSSTLYLSEPMIELAELIAGLSGIPDAKVFFTTSGTEANDAALMLATTYRKSNQVLAMRNSYHGRSFTTIAITAQRSWSPTSVSGLSVNYVHGGYRLRSPFRAMDDDAYTTACVDDLTQVFDMMTSGDVAAMIAEPIQGVGGFATPPDGFFGAMKKELDNRGVLFISDEVQTGWGRTGDHFWGYQAHGITPDILTFAKGVGNGLALGGVVASAELMDSLPGNSLSTFGGNPLSSAGALATINYMLDNDTQGNSKRMGGRLVAKLQPAVDDSTVVAELRGRGLMQAIETVQPGSLEPNVEAAGQIIEQARVAGLLIGKGGLYGNVLRIAPPMTVTEAEIDEAGDILVDCIKALD
ncbi:MAG: aspartate aminotransferase family protein [Actinobacteria bacterium]|jgi:4-aminobutyrate aminotransferase|nr:aspartate aminotransferase family protein [Actinomycetota bacterium]MBT3746879.1 aspartate aminotransferase family protein [Actinomycetota bacterium]MBT3970212.1 aspartate aminotransferase family protein [Actinomycetota bacterium]MBT4010135.1 aspartate aminotransferase family protein [Actinomycetota bacterium]MBT4303094.1 aspartate aminotransferase family protein [Actinomycetota bacterium]